MSSPLPEGHLRVLLHAHLRFHNDGEVESSVRYRPGATIAEYLAELAIPEHEFYGVVLDGILSGDRSLVPQEGSTLELLPAIASG